MKKEQVFDEETGAPMRRFTITLKGRSDEEIKADIDRLFMEIDHAHD